MIIQVNTDSSIENNEKLTTYVKEVVAKSLNRFTDKVTRIEVHLHDENAHKSGSDDKRCRIEARLAGHQPLTVTEHTDSIDKSIAGACDKMKSALDSLIGRISKH